MGRSQALDGNGEERLRPEGPKEVGTTLKPEKSCIRNSIIQIRSGPTYDFTREDGCEYRWYPDGRIELKNRNQKKALTQLVRLGGPGNRYVSSSLQNGLWLARRTLEALDIGRGTAFSFLPEGIDPRVIERFDQGGIVAMMAATDSRWSWAAQLVAIAMSTAPTSVFIAENALSNCDDPVITRNHGGITCSGQEVYHWTERRDPEAIEALMNDANSSYILNCLVSCPSPEFASGYRPARCDEEVLSGLASGVRLVVVGAWDSEGCILWTENAADLDLLLDLNPALTFSRRSG